MVEAAFESKSVLPSNLEAERALLGCLILDNRLIDAALDQFPPGAAAQARDAGKTRRRGEAEEPLFFSQAHQTVFGAIIELYEASTPIDLTTLAEKLLLKGQLEAVGGAPFLAGLEEDIFAPGQASEYARIIVEKWRLRRLIRTAQSIAEQAAGAGAEDVTAMIETAEQKIFAIGQDQRQADFVHVGDVIADKITEIEDRSKSGGGLPGLETGFEKLDQMTGGLRPANMIIIAARPSMGKTAFAMNIASHIALRRKKPVGLFSLEMSTGEVTSRLLCAEAHVSMGRVLSGKPLRRGELDLLHEAAQRLDAAPLHIDDASTLSALEMRARARRLKARCPDLSLLIVDYLQLMHGGGFRYDNRQQEVTEISRSIKALARELEIPIIALSQLSRQSEQRRGTKDKMPKLSDLRECVTGDTPVQLADGRKIKIASLVGTTPEVVAIDANGRLTRAVSDAVWRVGRRPIFKVTLASGRTIRATAEHRLLGPNGWVRVGKLSIGDRLATGRRILEPKSLAEWPNNRLVLLGQLIGDGSYLSGQSMRYTTASEENSEAVENAAKVEFGCEVKRYAGRGKWHQLLISGNGDRWHSKGVNQWLRELGIFGQRSHEKRVPESVFCLSNSQVAIFLKHLWATDGCVAVRKKNTRGGDRIYFSSCSRELVEDVGSLLLRFGVLNRIRVTEQKNHRPVYTVDVSGSENQKLFLNEIGCFGPRCEHGLLLSKKLLSIEPNTNVDTLPKEVFDDVRAAMSRKGITQRRMAALRGTAYGGSSHFSFAPSRSTLASYAELLEDEKLGSWAQSDIFWDRVLKIEPAGEEDVYDLTVPGPHSWLAGDIISHNSGAIEQDADVVMFIHRERNMQQGDGPAQPDLATIRIGKQRNGPVGDFDMLFHGEFTQFVSLAPGA